MKKMLLFLLFFGFLAQSLAHAMEGGGDVIKVDLPERAQGVLQKVQLRDRNLRVGAGRGVAVQTDAVHTDVSHMSRRDCWFLCCGATLGCVLFVIPAFCVGAIGAGSVYDRIYMGQHAVSRCVGLEDDCLASYFPMALNETARAEDALAECDAVRRDCICADPDARWLEDDMRGTYDCDVLD